MEQLTRECCADTPYVLRVCYDRGFVLHLVRAADDAVVQFVMGGEGEPLETVAGRLLEKLCTRGLLKEAA